MRVGEFCNRDVVIINSDESVKVAAELMRKHHVGDLVVLEDQKIKLVPIGIITDRDLVVEVMAPGISTESLAVRDILTEPLAYISEENSLYDALELMNTKKVRRLPVVNQDTKLVGIITIDDIIEILSEMMGQLVSVTKLQQKKEEKLRA